MAIDPQLTRRFNALERQLDRLERLLSERPQQYYNITQVAGMCGISGSMVRKLIAQGEVEMVVIGRRQTISASEVVKLQTKYQTKNIDRRCTNSQSS